MDVGLRGNDGQSLGGLTSPERERRVSRAACQVSLISPAGAAIAAVVRGRIARTGSQGMQVVILCGGHGTRIRDVADDIPKPMIPIGGQPILWHIMKSYAHFGFRRFILCLGYKSWSIKQYFLDYALASSDLTVDLDGSAGVRIRSPYRLEDWEVTLAETGLDTMTGGRVKRIQKYLDGEHFMLTYGDGVADVDLGKLASFALKSGKLGTVTAVQPPSRFGEIEIEDGRVVECNEKPPVTQGYINGGFLVFHRRFVERLPERDDLVLEHGPLYDLAHEGELTAYVHRGFWHCMDSSRDYHLLNNLWARGTAPWCTWAAQTVRTAA
jgi:glucose-1-phosphate cytidylyltransferase